MSTPPAADEPRRPPDPAWAPTLRVGPPPSRAAAARNALPAGTRLDEFELLQVIGEGGFGIVYLAQDHALQRRVAVKEYLPASLAGRAGGLQVEVLATRQRAVFDAGLDSFVNEARLLARFDHPALVKVHRFWQAHGTAYMVMPYYEGETLQQALSRRSDPPDERWLMALLAPLTEALAVIHGAQWLHRDLAPDNILLLADSGRPLLLDFGAARQVIGDATQALTAILKPGYAPVEQYADTPALRQGPWTDVYALCAVVYAAITGRKPTPAVARSVHDELPLLQRSQAGRYSPRFLQAIDAGLRVRPDERTASIAALRQALGLDEAASMPATPAAAPASADALSPTAQVGHGAAPRATAGDAASAPALPPTGTSDRPRWPWAAAAGLLLLAATAAAFWAGTRSPAPDPVPHARVAPADTPTAPSAAPPADPRAPTAPSARPDAAGAAGSAMTVAEAFDRIVQARQAGFPVEAQPDQARLHIGRDRLGFAVRSGRDGHVYVLTGGSEGVVRLLFPNTMAGANRIRAGETLHLPQASWPMETTEPVGTEHFVVIVSEQARDFAHLGPEREAWFLRMPADALQRPAGAGGAPLAGRAACAAPGCDRYGAARFSVDVLR